MAIDFHQPVIAGVLNWARTATISASQAATGYPASNLSTPDYTFRWRSTSVGSAVTITFDLGATRTDLESFILLGTNFSDAATVRVIVDSDPAFPSPDHDSTTINAFDLSTAQPAGIDDSPPWGRPIVYLPSSGPWSGRYVRFTISDTLNPAAYLTAAYAIIGPTMQLGPSAVWTPSERWEGEAGTSISLQSHLLTFRSADPTVKRRAQSLSRALQGVGRFAMIPDPSRPETWVHEAILGRLADPVDYLALPGQQWDVTMTIDEVST